MGLDLYIEARIKAKKTGRVITATKYDKYEEEKGFFEVCYWPTYSFAEIRTGMIAICNRHGGSKFTDDDYFIPIPQSALCEIYAYLIKCSCLSDEDIIVEPREDVWQERYAYESANLENAKKLHELCGILVNIEKENHFWGDRKKFYIASEEDWKLFEKNPREYEWEFRIFNSY